MSGISPRSVKVVDVLWRTRGVHWDFETLIEPSVVPAEGWYSVGEQAFAMAEAFRGREPFVRGTVWLGGGPRTFVAAEIVDPALSDHTGSRRIRHKLLIVLPLGATAVPRDWPASVLSQMRPLFQTPGIYDLPEEEVRAVKNQRGMVLGERLRDAMAGLLASHPEVSLGDSELRDVGEVTNVPLKKKKRNEGSRIRPGRAERPFPTGVVMTLLVVFLIVLGLARSCGGDHPTPQQENSRQGE